MRSLGIGLGLPLGAGNGVGTPADTTSFIYQVKTTAPSELVTVPALATYSYDCDVSFEELDGTVLQVGAVTDPADATLSYTFPTAGTYRVRVTGAAERFTFNAKAAASGSLYIVEQIGKTGLTTCEDLFASCPNVISISFGSFDSSSFTDTESYFAHMCEACTSLTSINFTGMSVKPSATPTNPTLYRICYGCSALTVADFRGATGFNNVASLESAFDGCPLEEIYFPTDWTMENVSDLSYMVYTTAAMDYSYFDLFLNQAAEADRNGTLPHSINCHWVGVEYSFKGANAFARLVTTEAEGGAAWTISSTGLDYASEDFSNVSTVAQLMENPTFEGRTEGASAIGVDGWDSSFFAMEWASDDGLYINFFGGGGGSFINEPAVGPVSGRVYLMHSSTRSKNFNCTPILCGITQSGKYFDNEKYHLTSSAPTVALMGGGGGGVNMEITFDYIYVYEVDIT